MSSSPIFYWNEKLGKSIPHELVLTWKITGAKTVVPHLLSLPVYTTFDAIASQSTIDSFLQTTNEFTIAQFDATAMGTDAFGCLVNMSGATSQQTSTTFGGLVGQVASASVMEASVFSGTYNATTVNANANSGSLTASTLETAFAVGAYGNLAFKMVASGLDALTSGIIVVRLLVVMK